MKKTIDLKADRARKVDVGIKNILHLAELIQLSYYTISSLKGLLKYFIGQMNEKSRGEMERFCQQKFDSISTPLDTISEVIYKLHSYTVVNVEAVVNFPRLSTLNKAMGYFESGKLEHKYVVALWQELLDMFLKIVNNERRLANFQKISILELGIRLLASIESLHKQNDEKEISFGYYLCKKGLISQQKLEQIEKASRNQKKSLGEIVEAEQVLPPELLHQEWQVFETFSRKKPNFREEIAPYIRNGELTVSFQENLLNEVGKVHETLSQNLKAQRDSFYLFSQAKPFGHLLKTVFCHRELCPPPLWEELLEKGLFFYPDYFHDLNRFLRNTKYLQQRLNKQEVGSATVKKLCNLLEEETFADESVSSQSQVYEKMADSLFPEAKQSEKDRREQESEQKTPASSFTEAHPKDQQIGEQTELRLKPNQQPDNPEITGVRSKYSQEETGSSTEVRPRPNFESSAAFTMMRPRNFKAMKDMLGRLKDKKQPSSPNTSSESEEGAHSQKQEESSRQQPTWEQPEEVMAAEPVDTEEGNFFQGESPPQPSFEERVEENMSVPEMPRVLLIDDDPYFCQMITAMLQKVYDVTCINDPTQAIRVLDRINPEVLLLDYEMPQMNGLEVLKIIKRRKPELPVIMITGHQSTELGVSAVRIGAFDCINKPFSLDTLIGKVREATSSDSKNSTWTCKGKLESTPLIEVLQICSTVQHSGVLTIENEDDTFFIYFENGQVIDARYGEYDGFKALLRIALMGKGSFEFTASEEPHEVQTIEGDTDFLLLELARQCDEFEIMLSQFPDLETLVVPNMDLNDPILNKFITPLSISEILNSEPDSDYQVLQRISEMLENEQLQFVEEDLGEEESSES